MRRGRRGGVLRTGCAAIVLGGAVLGLLPAACKIERMLQESSQGPGRSTGPNLRPAPERQRGQGKRGQGSRETEPTTTAPPAPPPASPGAPATVHLALGVPTDADPSDDYLLVKPQYALSYNRRRNVPNWVSWNLDASYFGSAPRKKGKFLPDDSLPTGLYRVQDHDYAGSGFDRGHMVRSEERTRTPEDNTATFYLTNVLPQRHDLNAGPWLRLEEYSQELSQKEGKELYIVAGGIFAATPPTIGHGVAVPEDCFKIIVVLDRGQGLGDVTAETRVIAVIMPNTTGILDEPWGQYRTSVAEVERRTGYTFFPAVPEPARRALEARVDTGPTSGGR